MASQLGLCPLHRRRHLRHLARAADGGTATCHQPLAPTSSGAAEGCSPGTHALHGGGKLCGAPFAGRSQVRVRGHVGRVSIAGLSGRLQHPDGLVQPGIHNLLRSPQASRWQTWCHICHNALSGISREDSSRSQREAARHVVKRLAGYDAVEADVQGICLSQEPVRLAKVRCALHEGHGDGVVQEHEGLPRRWEARAVPCLMQPDVPPS
mmetsp:Transcript_107720/g.300165  ORF Transcript_107720/g.300165 Transcript_107720/m.300165 type:complete len:209 (-) Transcript_107720:2349-2975(-)